MIDSKGLLGYYRVIRDVCVVVFEKNLPNPKLILAKYDSSHFSLSYKPYNNNLKFNAR